MTAPLPVDPPPVWIIVEDDRDDRELITEILNQIGLQGKVRLFCDGEELIDYLDHITAKEALPSFILLDDNMPRLSGEATLMVLKSDPRYRTLPVAIFSTTLSPLRERALTARGAVHCRQKPADYAGMQSLLHTYAELSGLKRESAGI
jgi:CheY-like chemotaxis protein